MAYKLYGGATRADAISGLDPRFWGALEQMYAAAPPEVRAELGLNSAYRSIERQQQLWDASDKSGKMVAPPGKSKHNHGLAADLYGFGLSKGPKVSDATRAWVHSNAGQYGLYFPMDYEPWHIQWKGDAKSPSAAPRVAGDSLVLRDHGPQIAAATNTPQPQPAPPLNEPRYVKDHNIGLPTSTDAPQGLLALLKGDAGQAVEGGLASLMDSMAPQEPPQMLQPPMQSQQAAMPALDRYVAEFLASRLKRGSSGIA